jgi:hypothetical protein
MWHGDTTVSSIAWPGRWTRPWWNESHVRTIMEGASRDALPAAHPAWVMRWVSEGERG